MDAIVTAGGIPLPEEPLYPATLGESKALLDVAGKPMIQWVLDALSDSKTIENVIIVGLTEKSGLKCSKKMYFVSNQGKMVENLQAGGRKIKEINPQAEIGLLCGEDFIDIPDYPGNLQASAIHLPVDIAKKVGFIEKCHAVGLKVHVWTVDVKTDMKWMCEAGVDAFFTDCPDHARKIVDGDYSSIPF